MGAAAFATLTSTALGGEPAWKLKPGEWTSVNVDLRGPKAVVKIGEVATTFEHTSLARAKTNLSIGFSFGTVSVENWLRASPGPFQPQQISSELRESVFRAVLATPQNK